MAQSDGVPHFMRNQIGNKRANKPIGNAIEHVFFCLLFFLFSMLLAIVAILFALVMIPHQVECKTHHSHVQRTKIGSLTKAIDLACPTNESVKLLIPDE